MRFVLYQSVSLWFIPVADPCAGSEAEALLSNHAVQFEMEIRNALVKSSRKLLWKEEFSFFLCFFLRAWCIWMVLLLANSFLILVIRFCCNKGGFGESFPAHPPLCRCHPEYSTRQLNSLAPLASPALTQFLLIHPTLDLQHSFLFQPWMFFLPACSTCSYACIASCMYLLMSTED